MIALTPDLNIGVGHGLAGVDVKHLDVQVKGNTLLALNNIRADVLASDVVGALCDLRAKKTGRVGAEDDTDGCVQGVAGARLVRLVDRSLAGLMSHLSVPQPLHWRA